MASEGGAGFLGLLSRVGSGIKGSQLLSDPYLLSILAGSMAQAVDPEEAWTSKLGGTVAELSRGMKFGEAATKEKDERKEYLDSILKLLGGGFTAPDQPGITSAKFGPGKVTIDAMTPEGWSPVEGAAAGGYLPKGRVPGPATGGGLPGAPIDYGKLLGGAGNF